MQPKDNDDEDDDDDDDENPTDKKNDKKKKKKKTKKDKEEKKDTSATSATGKAILLRQQQLAEEEARLKKLREEEEARIREEEEREAAELKAIEDEKERKRKAKQDKVEAQKAAGTYMTKAEKEKARKQKERLEAMKQSGYLVMPGANAPQQSSNIDNTNTSKPSAKSQPKIVAPLESEPATTIIKEADVPQSAPIPLAAAPEVPEADDWDTGKNNKCFYLLLLLIPMTDTVVDALLGDWETSADSIVARVNGLVLSAESQKEEEDQLHSDDKAKQQQLRQLGLERAKRDEEARLKK